MPGNAARAKLRERARATKQKLLQKHASTSSLTAGTVGDGGDEGKKEASPVKAKNCAQCFFCRWEAAHGPIFPVEKDKEKQDAVEGRKNEEEGEEEERNPSVGRI